MFINRVGKVSKADAFDIPKGRHLVEDANPGVYFCLLFVFPRST
jgi:hypothetical protein